MAVYMQWSTISTAPLQIGDSSFSPCHTVPSFLCRPAPLLPYSFIPLVLLLVISVSFSCSAPLAFPITPISHFSSLLLSFTSFPRIFFLSSQPSTATLFSSSSLLPFPLLTPLVFLFTVDQNLFLLEMPLVLLVFFLRNSLCNLMFEVYIPQLEKVPSAFYLDLRALLDVLQIPRKTAGRYFRLLLSPGYSLIWHRPVKFGSARAGP